MMFCPSQSHDNLGLGLFSVLIPVFSSAQSHGSSYIFYEMTNSYEFVWMTYNSPHTYLSLSFIQIVQDRTSEVIRIRTN